MDGHDERDPRAGEDDDQVRPRPRVVDKRVSSRGGAAPADRTEPVEAPAEQPKPVPEPASEPVPAPQETVWTPEQEAEARRVVEEIDRVPAQEWILAAATNLVNVAGVKIDRGKPEDARLAIDALGALLDGVGARLGEAEPTLRGLLAQLQMAYAQSGPATGRSS